MARMSFRHPSAMLLVLAGLAFGPGHEASAQQAAGERWTVDPTLSAAWWQIYPHLNHLWATTCPSDPSWQPGEGRSGGWFVDYALRSKSYYGEGADERKIPLYPRFRARPVCEPAVSGSIVVQDPDTWTGVSGYITVRGDELVTGNTSRDIYAQRAIMNTGQHPDLRFDIASATLTAHGDTLRGEVRGEFEFRGVRKPITAPLVAWEEAGGLRVQSQFAFGSDDLTKTFGVSKRALGLGVGLHIWNEMHMGIDVVLKAPRRQD